MSIIQVVAASGQKLAEDTVRRTLHRALEGEFNGRKVLVLIPDHTRSLPLPLLFRTLVEALLGAEKLDFLVALGTHPPLSEDRLCGLVGIRSGERRTKYRPVGLINHSWDDPSALASLGWIPKELIRQFAGKRWHPSLGGDTEVRVNRLLLDYDHILIVAPTFPHEVAGFSGGGKYIIPGVSGPQMINTTHWLGALSGVMETIGVKDTPVRAMVNAAASKLPTPVTLLGMVVEGHDLSGLFVGDLISAWSAAADLSSERHIRRCAKPFRKILSCPMPMYDELWTAAKAVYKLEPVVAEGGEIIVYAPHLDTISRTHGKYIYEVGYHVLPYFLEDWERFKEFPLAVLAHSTHVRGSGRMEGGVERPAAKVTLASRISAEDCARLNLGYCDPASIRPEEWRNREDEGVLYVPNSGEILYRLRAGDQTAGEGG
ncbi:MAG: lactate racemase domain-containing protein [Anaerolineales bacterium]